MTDSSGTYIDVYIQSVGLVSMQNREGEVIQGIQVQIVLKEIGEGNITLINKLTREFKFFFKRKHKNITISEHTYSIYTCIIA